MHTAFPLHTEDPSATADWLCKRLGYARRSVPQGRTNEVWLFTQTKETLVLKNNGVGARAIHVTCPDNREYQVLIEGLTMTDHAFEEEYPLPGGLLLHVHRE